MVYYPVRAAIFTFLEKTLSVCSIKSFDLQRGHHLARRCSISPDSGVCTRKDHVPTTLDKVCLNTYISPMIDAPFEYKDFGQSADAMSRRSTRMLLVARVPRIPNGATPRHEAS